MSTWYEWHTESGESLFTNVKTSTLSLKKPRGKYEKHKTIKIKNSDDGFAVVQRENTLPIFYSKLKKGNVLIDQLTSILTPSLDPFLNPCKGAETTQFGDITIDRLQPFHLPLAQDIVSDLMDQHTQSSRPTPPPPRDYRQEAMHALGLGDPHAAPFASQLFARLSKNMTSNPQQRRSMHATPLPTKPVRDGDAATDEPIPTEDAPFPDQEEEEEEEEEEELPLLSELALAASLASSDSPRGMVLGGEGGLPLGGEDAKEASSTTRIVIVLGNTATLLQLATPWSTLPEQIGRICEDITLHAALYQRVPLAAAATPLLGLPAYEPEPVRLTGDVVLSASQLMDGTPRPLLFEAAIPPGQRLLLRVSVRKNGQLLGSGGGEIHPHRLPLVWGWEEVTALPSRMALRVQTQQYVDGSSSQSILSLKVTTARAIALPPSPNVITAVPPPRIPPPASDASPEIRISFPLIPYVIRLAPPEGPGTYLPPMEIYAGLVGSQGGLLPVQRSGGGPLSLLIRVGLLNSDSIKDVINHSRTHVDLDSAMLVAEMKVGGQPRPGDALILVAVTTKSSHKAKAFASYVDLPYTPPSSTHGRPAPPTQDRAFTLAEACRCFGNRVFGWSCLSVFSQKDVCRPPGRYALNFFRGAPLFDSSSGDGRSDCLLDLHADSLSIHSPTAPDMLPAALARPTARGSTYREVLRGDGLACYPSPLIVDTEFTACFESVGSPANYPTAVPIGQLITYRMPSNGSLALATQPGLLKACQLAEAALGSMWLELFTPSGRLKLTNDIHDFLEGTTLPPPEAMRDARSFTPPPGAVRPCIHSMHILSRLAAYDLLLQSVVPNIVPLLLTLHKTAAKVQLLQSRTRPTRKQRTHDLSPDILRSLGFIVALLIEIARPAPWRSREHILHAPRDLGPSLRTRMRTRRAEIRSHRMKASREFPLPFSGLAGTARHIRRISGFCMLAQASYSAVRSTVLAMTDSFLDSLSFELVHAVECTPEAVDCEEWSRRASFSIADCSALFASHASMTLLELLMCARPPRGYNPFATSYGEPSQNLRLYDERKKRTSLAELPFLVPLIHSGTGQLSLSHLFHAAVKAAGWLETLTADSSLSPPDAAWCALAITRLASLWGPAESVGMRVTPEIGTSIVATLEIATANPEDHSVIALCTAMLSPPLSQVLRLASGQHVLADGDKCIERGHLSMCLTHDPDVSFLAFQLASHVLAGDAVGLESQLFRHVWGYVLPAAKSLREALRSGQGAGVYNTKLEQVDSMVALLTRSMHRRILSAVGNLTRCMPGGRPVNVGELPRHILRWLQPLNRGLGDMGCEYHPPQGRKPDPLVGRTIGRDVLLLLTILSAGTTLNASGLSLGVLKQLPVAMSAAKALISSVPDTESRMAHPHDAQVLLALVEACSRLCLAARPKLLSGVGASRAVSQQPEKVEHDSSQHYDAIELQAILLTIQTTALRLLKCVAASPILSRPETATPCFTRIMRTALATSASRSPDLTARLADCAAEVAAQASRVLDGRLPPFLLRAAYSQFLHAYHSTTADAQALRTTARAVQGAGDSIDSKRVSRQLGERLLQLTTIIEELHGALPAISSLHLPWERVRPFIELTHVKGLRTVVGEVRTPDQRIKDHGYSDPGLPRHLWACVGHHLLLLSHLLEEAEDIRYHPCVDSAAALLIRSNHWEDAAVLLARKAEVIKRIPDIPAAIYLSQITRGRQDTIRSMAESLTPPPLPQLLAPAECEVFLKLVGRRHLEYAMLISGAFSDTVSRVSAKDMSYGTRAIARQSLHLLFGCLPPAVWSLRAGLKALWIRGMTGQGSRSGLQTFTMPASMRGQWNQPDSTTIATSSYCPGVPGLSLPKTQDVEDMIPPHQAFVRLCLSTAPLPRLSSSYCPAYFAQSRVMAPRGSTYLRRAKGRLQNLGLPSEVRTLSFNLPLIELSPEDLAWGPRHRSAQGVLRMMLLDRICALRLVSGQLGSARMVALELEEIVRTVFSLSDRETDIAVMSMRMGAYPDPDVIRCRREEIDERITSSLLATRLPLTVDPVCLPGMGRYAAVTLTGQACPPHLSSRTFIQRLCGPLHSLSASLRLAMPTLRHTANPAAHQLSTGLHADIAPLLFFPCFKPANEVKDALAELLGTPTLQRNGACSSLFVSFRECPPFSEVTPTPREREGDQAEQEGSTAKHDTDPLSCLMDVHLLPVRPQDLLSRSRLPTVHHCRTVPLRVGCLVWLSWFGEALSNNLWMLDSLLPGIEAVTRRRMPPKKADLPPLTAPDQLLSAPPPLVLHTKEAQGKSGSQVFHLSHLVSHAIDLLVDQCSSDQSHMSVSFSRCRELLLPWVDVAGVPLPQQAAREERMTGRAHPPLSIPDMWKSLYTLFESVKVTAFELIERLSASCDILQHFCSMWRTAHTSTPGAVVGQVVPTPLSDEQDRMLTYLEQRTLTYRDQLGSVSKTMR